MSTSIVSPSATNVTLAFQNVHRAPSRLPPGRHGPTEADAGAATAAKAMTRAMRRRTFDEIGRRLRVLSGEVGVETLTPPRPAREDRQVASGVFISYRREDAPGHTGRLYDRLSQRFGEARVFMDVDSIDIGVDFVTALMNAVESSEVVLVIIGPRWIEARERLDDPNDYVRVEIQAALERDVRVVPVLVHGGRLPSAEELPEPLQPLVRRHAIELADASFQSDARQLIERLERVLDEAPPAAKPTPEPERAGTPWQVTARRHGRRVFAFEVTLADSTHHMDVEFRDLASNIVRLDGTVVPIAGNKVTKEHFEFSVDDGPVQRSGVLTLELGMFSPKAIRIEVDGRTIYHGLET
jgi:hypothetical protein